MTTDTGEDATDVVGLTALDVDDTLLTTNRLLSAADVNAVLSLASSRTSIDRSTT